MSLELYQIKALIMPSQEQKGNITLGNMLILQLSYDTADVITW